MSVRRSEVDRIATLAHLLLSDSEADQLTVELNGILEHVANLEEDEESALGEESLADSRPSAPEPQRPDPLARPPEEFAPAWRDGFFVVPRLPALGTGHDDGGAPE